MLKSDVNISAIVLFQIIHQSCMFIIETSEIDQSIQQNCNRFLLSIYPECVTDWYPLEWFFSVNWPVIKQSICLIDPAIQIREKDT